MLTMLDGVEKQRLGSSMRCTAEKDAILISRKSLRGETYIELSEEEQECLVKTICQEAYDVKKVNKPSKRMRG